MRQEMGNDKLDMYSAVLMYMEAGLRKKAATAGLAQKGIFTKVQKMFPVRSRTTWAAVKRLQSSRRLQQLGPFRARGAPRL